MNAPDRSLDEPPSLGLINIGMFYTGNIASPVGDVEALYIADGKVQALGSNHDILSRSPKRVADVQGMTVMPGLIDCHVHPHFGDFTARFKLSDWIGGYGRGGVTTVVSQGVVHLPGRPRDALGAKLIAMLSAQTFAEYHPDGVKVAAGAVMLEPGLTDEDFGEMWRAGVRNVAEIGISGVSDPQEAAPMVRAAHAVGMRVSMHFGGPSIVGSRAMGVREALAIGPDVIAHVNGGSTGRSDEEILGVIDETNAFVEACYHGGLRQLLLVANALAERRQLGRLIFGSDSPSAIGITPQAIFRMISWIAGLTDISIGELIAAASGNAQRAFNLGSGTLAEEQIADILVVDAPIGSMAHDVTGALTFGDMPGIAMIAQNGIVMEGRAFNCPFPKRAILWTERTA
jgi:enamidase